MPRKGAKATSRNKAKVVHSGTSTASTAQSSKGGSSAVPSGASDANTSTDRVSESKEGTTLYGRIRSLAKHGRKYLVAQLGLAIPSIFLMLLGIKEMPHSIPMLSIIEQHPVASPIIGGILLVVALAGLIISFSPEPGDRGNALKRGNNWHSRNWIIATAMSTTSFVVSSTFLAVVLIHPSWCPSSLCSDLYNPNGVHDKNLEAYFLTFESSAYAIPGDPAHTSLLDVSNERNPGTIGAVLIKNGKSTSIYRIVIMLRSYYQGKYSILIDQVTLIVADLPLLPRPLKVWPRGSNISYDASRYGITYDGEGKGSHLPTKDLRSQNGYTQLASQESDPVDVQIDSRVPVNLKFQIQVTYHIATDSMEYTLTLPQTFEVVFSDRSNWHTYQPQTGHFAPSP